MSNLNQNNDDIQQTCRQLGLDNEQTAEIAADIQAGEAVLEAADRETAFDAGVIERTEQRMRRELNHRRWRVRLQRIAAVIVMALVIVGLWRMDTKTTPTLPDSGNRQITKTEYEIPLWSIEVTRVNHVEQQIDPVALAEVAALFHDCWYEDDIPDQSLAQGTCWQLT